MIFYTVEHSSRGVGLSANQVGRLEAISVIAIKSTPARPNLHPLNKVCINTEIVKTFGRREPMWEGRKNREIVDGFVAHVVQHETNHLNGVLLRISLIGMK